jgi:predicted DNA-binding transcriptional regulator YafY
VPPSKTAERVRRLLAVVPYAVQHPGTPLDELARLFGATEQDLLTDLNMLMMTGLPPYSPGDLIEVDVEEGRVWIRMADHLSRPARLTRAEALALYLRGTELVGSAGLEEADALRSALAKIAGGLGLEGLPVEAGEQERSAPSHLAAVRGAVERRERLEIDYFSASRNEVTTRRIDPEHVLAAMGHWYVVAWCHRAKGERLFRVDRIRATRETGERFEPRGLAGQGRDLYTPTEEDVRVRLRLGPGARWVAEYYAVERAVQRGGGLEVTLPTRDLGWVARLVLRLAGEAKVLAPPALAEAARRVARETLALYR